MSDQLQKELEKQRNQIEQLNSKLDLLLSLFVQPKGEKKRDAGTDSTRRKNRIKKSDFLKVSS